MTLIDAMILTLVNIISCVVVCKLLSVIMAVKNKRHTSAVNANSYKVNLIRHNKSSPSLPSQ